MDVVAFGTDAAKNSALMKRAAFTATSNVMDMVGRIHADIFFQDRYLINEANVKIKLVRSKDAFSIMSANDHQTVVVKSVLFVRMRKVRLSPSVVLAHAKALENATEKYPIKRVVCKTLTIPGGYRDVNHEMLFSGQLPTRLVIGWVDNGAFNGVKTKNPFTSQHFHLVEISLYSDGQQQYGMKPLTTDFTNKLYVRGFNTLFSGIGKLFKDEGNAISRESFGTLDTRCMHSISRRISEKRTTSV